MYRSQKWGFSSRKTATQKCFKAHTVSVSHSSKIISCVFHYSQMQRKHNQFRKKLQVPQSEQAETSVSNHPPRDAEPTHTQSTLCVWQSWGRGLQQGPPAQVLLPAPHPHPWGTAGALLAPSSATHRGQCNLPGLSHSTDALPALWELLPCNFMRCRLDCLKLTRLTC